MCLCDLALYDVDGWLCVVFNAVLGGASRIHDLSAWRGKGNIRIFAVKGYVNQAYLLIRDRWTARSGFRNPSLEIAEVSPPALPGWSSLPAHVNLWAQASWFPAVLSETRKLNKNPSRKFV